MNKWLIAMLLAVFSLGFFSASFTTQIVNYPLSLGSLTGAAATEKLSPGDHIQENQIHVYNDKIVLDIPEAVWSEFADTNSMDPMLDKGANGIEIKPQSPEDIAVGDVISYKSNEIDGVIIHRVVSISEDEQGKYFIVKGDNNPIQDPENVRFEQVQGILVGVIY